MPNDQKPKDSQEAMLSMLRQAVDKMDDVRGDVSQIDKKLDLHIQKTEYELQKINQLDETQNSLLDQHIAGVNTLRNMHELHRKEVDVRLQKLEEPHKLVRGIVRIIVTLGAVAGALAAVLKLLG